MSKKKPPKQSSGGARLIASGKKPVSLGIWPDDHAVLTAAAQEERIPLTMFLIRSGLEAAKKILEKKKQSH